MGKFEFIAIRKKGVEPSQIPAPLSEEILRWVDEQTGDGRWQAADEMNEERDPLRPLIPINGEAHLAAPNVGYGNHSSGSRVQQVRQHSSNDRAGCAGLGRQR